ncbi:hypothetical protein CEXT_469871 [Caerostris extrusa]|uniref:Uncharacterized protein n=1 Tax=Caerostris extrusa TaxID=172846 RepID=A0AAV4WDM4_CAEEX|nr:hypothetical protein CEXT_469871 [Caerostris extrusa]
MPGPPKSSVYLAGRRSSSPLMEQSGHRLQWLWKTDWRVSPNSSIQGERFGRKPFPVTNLGPSSTQGRVMRGIENDVT